MPSGPVDALGVDRPGVVDHHVQARLRREDLGDRRADGRERSHVGDDDREAVLAVDRARARRAAGRAAPRCARPG